VNSECITWGHESKTRVILSFFGKNVTAAKNETSWGTVMLIIIYKKIKTDVCILRLRTMGKKRLHTLLKPIYRHAYDHRQCVMRIESETKTTLLLLLLPAHTAYRADFPLLRTRFRDRVYPTNGGRTKTKRGT